MIDFSVQYPVFIADPLEWSALGLNLDGVEIQLLKPVSMFLSLVPGPEMSSNLPQSAVTSVRFVEDADLSHSPTQLAPLLTRVLSWLRTTCRQFWILSGIHGSAAKYYATTFLRREISIEQTFSVYAGGVVVKPLRSETWRALASFINEQHLPPVSDSLFCDGLNSLVSDDYKKAITEFGIAAEIEISTLLNNVSAISSSSSTKREYERKKDALKDHFGWKFREATVGFGLTDPRSFTCDGGPSGWANTLLDLYKLRNKVVHSGECLVKDAETRTDRPVSFMDVAHFAFAVEMLFQWSDEQRAGFSLPPVRPGWGTFKSRPISSINDARLEASSQPVSFPQS